MADRREQFTAATLADLYDPNAMPKPLLDAHRANNEAVVDVYGTRRFKTDLERLEFLFDLYRQYTDPLTRIAEKKPAASNAGTKRLKVLEASSDLKRCLDYS
jgi:hypothetical protein